MKKTLPPHIFFLALGLISGLALCIIVPPLKVPDEISHFARAYEISQGVILSPKEGPFSGSVIPDSIIALHTQYGYPAACDADEKASPQDIIAHLGDPLNPSQTSFFKNNATFYFPSVYAPASLVIWVGRAAGASPLALLYLGRIAIMLVAVIITALAIRITPIYKWLFVFLSIVAAAATQRASLSADSLTNAFALLLLAMTLRLGLDPRQTLNVRAVFELIVVGVFVGLAKQAYLVLPFLALLAALKSPISISIKEALAKRGLWMGIAAVVGVCAIATLAWNKATANLNDYWDILADAKPGEQIEWVLTHPPNTIAVFLRTVVPGLPAWIFQIFGNFGFCRDGAVFLPVTLAAMAFFVFLLFADGAYPGEPSVEQRVVLVGVGLAASFLALLANYLINIKGNYTIEGVVGRYFLPIAPVLCAAVYRPNTRYNVASLSMIASVIFTLALFAAVLLRYF